MKDCGSITMSFYNNLISLPILLIISFLIGEFNSLLISIYIPKLKSILIVFLSCFCGFVLSVSAFSLNKLISPTSMMVANNLNKFILIILSEILIEWTLDINSSLGAIFVLFCGWLYSQKKEYFEKYLFFFVTILFLILYFIIQFKDFIIIMINQKFILGLNRSSFNNESQIININLNDSTIIKTNIQ
jgi:hypothetical protein